MSDAIMYRRFGGPEVLEMGTVPEEQPGPGQLLVEVRAAGLNPIDAKSFQGPLPLRAMELIGAMRDPERRFGRGPARFPRIVGRDFAGRVRAVGDGVTGFNVGQEILGTLRSAPSEGTIKGTLTQSLIAPSTDCVARPSTIPIDVAACLGVAAQTASGALRALSVHDNDVLVVTAAAGGVGTIATRLAALRGATVIGVAASDDADSVRRAGATPVDFAGDIAASIRRSAPGHVTKFLDCFGGGYIKIATDLGVEPKNIGTLVPGPAMILKGARFTGARHAQPEDLPEVVDLVARHAIQINVVRQIPFDVDAVRSAYLDLLNGAAHGKTVVHVAP